MTFNEIFTTKTQTRQNNNNSVSSGGRGFRVKKGKKQSESVHQKIQIDYREKQSLVPSQLVKLGFEIEFKELKVGDYIVKNFVIERKTISDFRNSMINKHLLKQIEELKQFENKILIIEGYENEDLYKNNSINPNSLRGFLISIVSKHKIPIIFSKNEQDTARFISVIANKKEIEISQIAKKKTYNKKEQMQFILESFPGIGPKNARKLLEKLGTLQNVFSASQDELKKILGKKAKIFMLLEENY